MRRMMQDCPIHISCLLTRLTSMLLPQVGNERCILWAGCLPDTSFPFH